MIVQTFARSSALISLTGESNASVWQMETSRMHPRPRWSWEIFEISVRTLVMTHFCVFFSAQHCTFVGGGGREGEGTAKANETTTTARGAEQRDSRTRTHTHTPIHARRETEMLYTDCLCHVHQSCAFPLFTAALLMRVSKRIRTCKTGGRQICECKRVFSSQ